MYVHTNNRTLGLGVKRRIHIALLIEPLAVAMRNSLKWHAIKMIIFCIARNNRDSCDPWDHTKSTKTGKQFG
jgi:hypothetical protein